MDVMDDEYSTIALLRANLRKLGYVSETIELGNSGFEKFVSPSGRIWTTANNRISYPFLTSSARPLCASKNLSYTLVERLGGSIPKTFPIVKGDTSEADMSEMLSLAPLVVKPNKASLSNGLTLDVTTKQQLIAAIERARQFSPKVLVQQQVEGEEVRFVVLNGEVSAAILRQKPRVTGDGIRTVGELIDRENKARLQIDVPYLRYPQLKSPIIQEDALPMEKIPAKGEVMILGKGTMIRSGASMYNITSTIHQSYINTATKFAQALGNGFVVVDMFVQDTSKPLTNDNYTFIEFNLSPVVKLFYSCRDGNQYDILKQLIPLIDQAIQGDKK